MSSQFEVIYVYQRPDDLLESQPVDSLQVQQQITSSCLQEF